MKCREVISAFVLVGIVVAGTAATLPSNNVPHPENPPACLKWVPKNQGQLPGCVQLPEDQSPEVDVEQMRYDLHKHNWRWHERH